VDASDRIIAGLLDLARQKPPARRSVDVNGVVREALYRAGIPENVDVVSRLDDTLPAIQADPDQLDRAFANVILNAVQAMPGGGRLSVCSESPAPGWVAVSFTDSGAGFSDEQLSRVFQPLFTTKVNGIGLGLAISRLMVEAHGGSIGVRSVIGTGTTFTVRLPAASEGEREDGGEGTHLDSGRQCRPARDAVPYPARAGVRRRDGGRDDIGEA
jgi:signal transduction histidine kinase